MTGGKGEAKRLTQAKTPADGEGQAIEDFCLAIEDLADPETGNPTAGVRVVYKTVEQVDPPRDPRADLDAAINRVRDVIHDNPNVAGKDAVRELAGLAAGKVRAAVDTLEATGEVENVKAGSKGVALRLTPRGLDVWAARRSR